MFTNKVMNTDYLNVKKYLNKNVLYKALAIIGVIWMAHAIVVRSKEKPNETVQAEQSFKIEEKVFGKSVAGKDIRGYVIGRGGSDTIFLFGAIHGDEVGTVDLLEQLVDEIREDNDLVSRSKQLIVIPDSNPDGYEDRTDKLNANGVNLNLNFGTSDWQTRGPEGTFAGKEAFSEPESRVIKDIVEQYKPNVMISYHSQGAVVSPELMSGSIELAKWYAEKSGYQFYTYWDYPGTSTKWFEQTTGKPAITVELKTDLDSDWESNRIPLLELIK